MTIKSSHGAIVCQMSRNKAEMRYILTRQAVSRDSEFEVETFHRFPNNIIPALNLQQDLVDRSLEVITGHHVKVW